MKASAAEQHDWCEYEDWCRHEDCGGAKQDGGPHPHLSPALNRWNECAATLYPEPFSADWPEPKWTIQECGTAAELLAARGAPPLVRPQCWPAISPAPDFGKSSSRGHAIHRLKKTLIVCAFADSAPGLIQPGRDYGAHQLNKARYASIGTKLDELNRTRSEVDTAWQYVARGCGRSARSPRRKSPTKRKINHRNHRLFPYTCVSTQSYTHSPVDLAAQRLLRVGSKRCPEVAVTSGLQTSKLSILAILEGDCTFVADLCYENDAGTDMLFNRVAG